MKEICPHLPPLFQENEVLFGHDATPGLIAFEIDGDNKVKIFRRDGDAMLLDTRRAPPTGSPRSLSPIGPAGKERLISGKDVDEARISCYVASTKKISENCKLASEWDQKNPRKPRAQQARLKEL